MLIHLGQDEDEGKCCDEKERKIGTQDGVGDAPVGVAWSYHLNIEYHRMICIIIIIIRMT